LEHGGQILFDLFVMFGCAKLLAELFERLSQPAVVGEILAGVLIGPHLLKWIGLTDVSQTLAEMGVIFLLFTVGLEIKPREVLQVGFSAGLVAILGVVVPFVLGFVIMNLRTHSFIEAVFVGAAMVATSVGITARVLSDLGFIKTTVARVILGAAVIDDILGMIILAVVSSLSTGEVNYLQISIVAAEAIAFTLIVVLLGGRVVRGISPRIEKMQTKDPYFVIALFLCLGLSVVATKIGIAAIIGAFLAGMALAERSETYHLHEKSQAICEFLGPFFFVVMGMQLNVRIFFNREIITLAVMITLAAIVGKLAGCGLGAYRLGFKSALKVGTGMVPRGEVGIIVALVGLTLHTISDSAYAVVLFMTVVTTLLAPPFLRILFRNGSTAV
jgi:Kef-type K+ transport system membrane component KefB